MWYSYGPYGVLVDGQQASQVDLTSLTMLLQFIKSLEVSVGKQTIWTQMVEISSNVLLWMKKQVDTQEECIIIGFHVNEVGVSPPFRTL